VKQPALVRSDSYLGVGSKGFLMVPVARVLRA
jgi:hypothetical protein